MKLASLSVIILAFVSFLNCPAPEKPLVSKSGFIEVGEAKLFYEEMGEGEPVIMIHGGFLNHHMWDDQFETFARHYRVIRYDARNHGQSAGVADTFAHFEDLQALMKSLQIEKAIIMGLSMGGYVATDFTLQYPGQVTALVLAAPGLSGYDFNDKYMAKMDSQLYGAIQQGDMKMFVEYFQQAWTDGPYRTPGEVDSSVREKVRQMAYGTVTNWNPASNEITLDPPATGRLAEIRVPTLAVVGDLDMPVILRIVDLVEAQIPGAKKVVIPGAAHMLNMEKPQEFNKVVLEFLANLSAMK